MKTYESLNEELKQFYEQLGKDDLTNPDTLKKNLLKLTEILGNINRANIILDNYVTYKLKKP